MPKGLSGTLLCRRSYWRQSLEMYTMYVFFFLFRLQNPGKVFHSRHFSREGDDGFRGRYMRSWFDVDFVMYVCICRGPIRSWLFIPTAILLQGLPSDVVLYPPSPYQYFLLLSFLSPYKKYIYIYFLWPCSGLFMLSFFFKKLDNYATGCIPAPKRGDGEWEWDWQWPKLPKLPKLPKGPKPPKKPSKGPKPPEWLVQFNSSFFRN